MNLTYPNVSDRYPEISDAKAVDEVNRGNREMFEVLVRRYNQQLFRVGMSYLRNPSQVEDAMQDTYLKAFVALGKFKRQSSLSTWLTRIMINECLMTIRSHRREGEVPLESVPEQPEPDAPQGEGRLNLKEMKFLLEQSIAGLPAKFRRVFVLREVQHMTTAETAACLKISPENVRVTLHRARDQLKTELLKTAAGAEVFSYPAEHCDPMTQRVMAKVLAIG